MNNFYVPSYMREDNINKKSSTTDFVTEIIKFFSLLMFTMGLAMLLSYKQSIGFFIGLITPLFATLIKISYQTTYMELFISEQKPFQIAFNTVVLSNIIIISIIIMIQIFHSKSIDFLSIVGWIYLEKEFILRGVLLAIVSGLSIVFSILNSLYLTSHLRKLIKILEIPLAEFFCVFILRTYDFITNPSYYLAIINILIVIMIIEFIEIFSWLKHRKRE